MIHYEDAPCWRLVTPVGADYDDGDGTAHFKTRQEAPANSHTEVLTGERFPAPCVSVSCDCCEEDLETDRWTMHFTDVTEANKAATASDWTVTKDGHHFCWNCSPNCSASDEATEAPATKGGE